MTNNDITTINSSTHGTFKVHTADLDTTFQAHSGWALDALISKIGSLVGSFDFDYSDLTYIEALVVITYLIGGAAD